MASDSSGDSEAQTRRLPRSLGFAILVVVLLAIAGAVGVFVLDLGGQGESISDASFETEEAMKSWNSPGEGKYVNAPQASVTLTGGPALEVANTRFLLDGVVSTYGLRNGTVTQINPGGTGRRVYMQPTPDICAITGSNEPATIEPGQSEHVMFATTGGSYEDGNLVRPLQFDPAPTHGELADTGACSNHMGSRRTDAPAMALSHSPESGSAYPPNREDNWGFTHAPTKGSTVTVVWKASSGGETQELLTYNFKNNPEQPDVG